uniref:Uncharacterized protein n=1 Tax=Arundo donax TaxID=35708 RepID=A0A0A9EPY7_ARUDO
MHVYSIMKKEEIV